MDFSLYKNYSNTFVFDSKCAGPIITIFGGIHGNEIVGINIIKKLISKLENNTLKLLKGKIIFAFGNEKAIKLGKKQYKYNLNRLFTKSYINSKKLEYEINRVKQLSDILKNSDILLDIHSVSCDSEAFIFCENIKNEIRIAKEIGTKKIIVGWGSISGDLLGGDTDGYMHNLGKKAFTIECGKHDSKEAFDIGYNTVLKLFNYYNIINGYNFFKNKEVNLFEMYKIETTKSGNFSFVNGMKNFMKIKKGEFIGIDGNIKIYAKEDFFILLPNYEKTLPGEEIFYYGRELSFIF